MPLQGPTQEDLRKIHAEVNQLVNQRFLLTTAGISVFGVVLAWGIPRTAPVARTPIGGFPIAVAALLLLLLFLLYLFSHHLRGMLRVYSTYLIVTQKSGWESDWEAYRAQNLRYWAYTKPQSIVFMVLGFFAALFPVLLAVFFSLRWEPALGLVVLGVCWVVYEILVFRMGFRDLWSTETSAKTGWDELNKRAV